MRQSTKVTITLIGILMGGAILTGTVVWTAYSAAIEVDPRSPCRNQYGHRIECPE